MKVSAMLICAVAVGAAIGAHAADVPTIVRRASLANARRVFETTGRGNVAFLGGSITEMPGWRVKVMDELKKRFPKTEFTFTCAGISSTCSDAGAYRLQEHVLAHGRPDLFFVEYAVNDAGDGYYLKGRHDPSTYGVHALRGVEGVVRHMREAAPQADIVMTFFVNGGQLNQLRKGERPKTYAIDGQVAERYGITTVSIGDALVSAERAGTFDWKKYGADCHPHAEGCVFIAGIYSELFDLEWKGTPRANSLVKHALPKPIDPLSYSRGRFLDFSKIECGDGWRVAGIDWKRVPGKCRQNYRNGPVLFAERPGATCKFRFKGTAVGAFILAGPDSGSVDVSIDGGAFKNFELFSPYSKGPRGLHYPFVETFADGLANREHTVILRVGSGKNPASTGNAVRLWRLCAN